MKSLYSILLLLCLCLVACHDDFETEKMTDIETPGPEVLTEQEGYVIGYVLSLIHI